MIIDKLPPNYINNIDDLFEHLYGVRPKKNGVSAVFFEEELIKYKDEVLNMINNNKYF